MPLKMYSRDPLPPASQIRNTIAVAAGKGGVGKSTVSVNLALSLRNLGFQVGILDADVYGPSIRRMLPEERLPVKEGEFFKPAYGRELRMISMAYFRKDTEAAAVRAPIANGFVQQFLKNVDWGVLDYLLIDFPPGTGDIQLTLAQHANLTGAIMVTTPQEVALLDVRKAINLFDIVQVPILGIVENMSYYLDPATGSKTYLFGKGGGQKLAEERGVPLLGQIPVDPDISLYGDTGASLIRPAGVETTETAKTFLNIAEALVSEVEKKTNPELAIRKVWQDVPEDLFIKWGDGSVQKIHLAALQKNCPCAHCADENTGLRKTASDTVEQLVGAKKVSGVGRYALKIHFTAGCSSGIYDYRLLRSLGNIQEEVLT